MYDFRFDTKLMQSFVGLQITSYKYTDTITEMVAIQIGDNVYCLTNEYEELDYFLLENAQFKKIVALSNLIQRIYHNDIRNMLP